MSTYGINKDTDINILIEDIRKENYSLLRNFSDYELPSVDVYKQSEFANFRTDYLRYPSLSQIFNFRKNRYDIIKLYKNKDKLNYSELEDLNKYISMFEKASNDFLSYYKFFKIKEDLDIYNFLYIQISKIIDFLTIFRKKYVHLTNLKMRIREDVYLELLNSGLINKSEVDLINKSTLDDKSSSIGNIRKNKYSLLKEYNESYDGDYKKYREENYEKINEFVKFIISFQKEKELLDFFTEEINVLDLSTDIEEGKKSSFIRALNTEATYAFIRFTTEHDISICNNIDILNFLYIISSKIKRNNEFLKVYNFNIIMLNNSIIHQFNVTFEKTLPE